MPSLSLQPILHTTLGEGLLSLYVRARQAFGENPWPGRGWRKDSPYPLRVREFFGIWAPTGLVATEEGC